MRTIATGFALLCAIAFQGQAALAASCDKACLEGIAAAYRTAYRAHDAKLAPFAPKVRFTENNVEMAFPDGTWDTVTSEVDSPLVLSDPDTGQVGIYTSIMQRDTQGFLAVRLRIRDRRITEVEHVISTRRNVSGPPMPIGDVWQYHRSPALGATVPVGERLPRADILKLADGTHTVSSVAAFDVKLLGFNAYRYRHQAAERWAQGCLVQIEANTNDNGRQLPVVGSSRSGRFQLEQANSSTARDGCVISYAYWDPERLLRQRELLNPQTGQFDAVQINSLGEETLVIRGATVRADRYRLRSDKFTIDLWYSKSGEWLQLDSTTGSNRQLRYRQSGIGKAGIVTTNSAPRSVVSTSDNSPP